MGRWDYYGYYYKPSVPIRAKGGIKAQSKRGSFGESWWARRWISVLEGFHIGARLGRGRSYARSGQVLSIEVGKGEVNAKVQGSRPKPYSVRIETKVLRPKDWGKIVGILSKEAIFVAKLLTGEMPKDIEEVFEKASLTLFPESVKDLKTSCSCPDWSNPCKHIAAVYYLLGEEFDRDPFLIFKLRGLEKEELIAMLRAKEKKEKVESETLSPREEEEPLPIEREKFWNGEVITDDFFGEVSIPEVHGALPKRLGSFPFWRGEEKFLDVMEKIYSNSSPIGLNLFLGEVNWKVGRTQN
jgi:uncharacterized Zn finger protein